MIVNIELTDLEFQALSVIAYDPVEWITNAAKVRANAAIEEVVGGLIQSALANGEPLPSGTKHEIFENANLPTAKEVTDAANAEGQGDFPAAP